MSGGDKRHRGVGYRTSRKQVSFTSAPPGASCSQGWRARRRRNCRCGLNPEGYQKLVVSILGINMTPPFIKLGAITDPVIYQFHNPMITGKTQHTKTSPKVFGAREYSLEMSNMSALYSIEARKRSEMIRTLTSLSFGIAISSCHLMNVNRDISRDVFETLVRNQPIIEM